MDPTRSPLPPTSLRKPILTGGLYAAVALMMLGYSIVILVMNDPWQRLIGPCIIVTTGSIAFVLQKKGLEHAAAFCCIWGAWGAVTFQGVVRFGVDNPALFGYPIVFLLGGWALGLRHGVVLCLASVAASLALALGWNEPLALNASPLNPMQRWITISMVLLSSMVAMVFFLRAHWKSVADTEALNTTLSQTVESLSKRQQALELSEQRFLKINASSPLPIAVSRLVDGRYFMVNAAWQREFGWSQEEAAGKTSLDLGFWASSDERADWISDLRRDGRTINRDISAITRDGKKRDLLLSAEIIDYEDQQCALAIFVDLTERRRIEQEIRQLNENLESRVQERTAELSQTLATLQRAQEELVHAEKLASLGKLVAGVAHELNTPIGNALVTVSTLNHVTEEFDTLVQTGNLRKTDLQHYIAQCKEGSNLAERSLHRASELVRSFKQVAVDQASERKREFDLGKAIAEVADTIRPNYKTATWELNIHIPDGITMDSYPGPLGQVVINLVMNAALHAFENRTHGNIVLSVQDLSDEDVTLVCADNGIGITKENQGRIFDPFFTTRLGQGGSGLGLSIVHRLVTQVLDGQIWLMSEPNQGTTFYVRLPRVVTGLAMP